MQRQADVSAYPRTQLHTPKFPHTDTVSRARSYISASHSSYRNHLPDGNSTACLQSRQNSRKPGKWLPAQSY